MWDFHSVCNSGLGLIIVSWPQLCSLFFMMTVANPLSAGLITMSWQVRSLVRASSSDVVRLSLLLTELIKWQKSIIFHCFDVCL